MKERMQNTGANAHGCPQRDRTASEGYVGVQTYMEIVEDELVEMHFEGECLMEQIIDIANLRKAYKQVVRNKGKGGVDGMDVKELFSWCQSHIEGLSQSLMSLAVAFPLSGRLRDLHPLEYAHAGRTNIISRAKNFGATDDTTKEGSAPI